MRRYLQDPQNLDAGDPSVYIVIAIPAGRINNNQ